MERYIDKSEFKQFINENNIVGTAAGVAVAYAGTDVIKSFVGDIVVPSIIFLFLSFNIPWISNILPGKADFNGINFVKQIINFIFTLVLTFLFIKITFEQLLGINKKKDVNTNSSVPIENTFSSPQQELQQQQQQQQQQPTKEHFIGGNGYSFL